jgi:hypothetical protein
MALHPNGRHTQLFTVRLWVEEIESNHSEWRGKVQRIPGGEMLYFRDWETMKTFLLSNLVAGTEEEVRKEPKL